ncbi:calcium-binding protein [Rhodoferax sp.]|uniref:calcium-binding protein n=1 Tax=Rhodoferax sp. TaxID=50421 RepID=UPI0025FEA143|nr:calcium-binding protein [Rhodoferax sp.]
MADAIANTTQADAAAAVASEGDDLLMGTSGEDVIYALGGNDRIEGLAGNDLLGGDAGDDQIFGGDGDDLLIGATGDDTLDGGAGGDDLYGGIGNNTYLFGRGDGQDRLWTDYSTDEGRFNILEFKDGILPSDVVVSSAYTDLVLSIAGSTDQFSVVGFLGPDSMADRYNPLQQVKFADGTVWSVDILLMKANVVTEGPDTLWGTSGDDVINALAGDDTVFGLAGDDVLDGGAGVDQLNGGDGNDTLIGGEGNDNLSGDNGNDTLFGGAGNDNLWGWDGDDTLDAGAGDDYLIGGAGKDTLLGGAGNDFYYVDDSGDVTIELVGEGTDLVLASASYTLGDNLENLTLMGDASDATGNAMDNALYGNNAGNTLVGGAGSDVIDGRWGADTMLGGTGDDTYFVENTGDVVTELPSEGVDTVYTYVNYTLGDNLESLVLTGYAEIGGTGNGLGNHMDGNSAYNILIGGGGDDWINGAEDADVLLGGVGDDAYYVDNVGDMVLELADEGTDTLFSSVSYTLAKNLEKMVLIGDGAVDATGNALDNNLLGNSAANTLTGGAGDDWIDGAAGADTMLGGTGNDGYFVDNTGDVVTELADIGIDKVFSSVSYTLGDNLEQLVLVGDAATNATGNGSSNYLDGNSAANILTGGAGNDWLNGAGGADTLLGGAGNDVYYVDSAGDLVTELAGEGQDTVFSSIDYTLNANVEELVLTGEAAVNATGNALGNLLVGNSADNTLAGGTGNDIYRLDRGFGADTIHEDDATAGNTDVAEFGVGVTADQLWFSQTGNNLDVTIIGSNDKFSITDWYLGNQHHVEQFKTSYGQTLLEGQVQNLVQAMAAFAPPAAGQTSLSSGYATELSPVLAISWG